MDARETTLGCAGLNANSKTDSRPCGADTELAHYTPTTLCSRYNNNSATSGVTSSGPNVGTTRRSGARNHSVSTYDQRIHFDHGEIWNHDAMIRTNIAIRMSANAQDRSSLAMPCGL